MNVLIIGKGGREHALIQSMQHSKSVGKVFSYPGRTDFDCNNLFDSKEGQHIQSPSSLIPYLKKHEIHLIVIGPEKELVEGWSDFFRQEGFLVFGPSKKAAQLEGSKIFSKEFMQQENIPTSRFLVVDSLNQVKEKSAQFQAPYVLKVDGLAAGKGVFICKTKEELFKNAHLIFEDNIFGDAGSKAILEQFQDGYELSVFVLTNGDQYFTLPLAQDFKKLKDQNEGPNTGGMGAVAPKIISSTLMKQIEESIVLPTIQGLKKQNLFYRGVVYVGIIVTKKGPFVLEYNVRFGDPECQVLLPMIEGDLAQHLLKIADGKIPKLIFKDIHTCLVVLSHLKYPYKTEKTNLEITRMPAHSPQSYFLHAGTSRDEKGHLISDGGRILNAVGIDKTAEQAQKNAYELIQKINTEKLHYRQDIS